MAPQQHGKAASGISEANTSVGSGSLSRQQLGVERRVAWLEEDVSVLHRRFKEECGEGGFAEGDQGLRALVARLDGELSAERRARQALEARLASMEVALQDERAERDAQMKAFSSELEVTLRGLITRIDGGLTSGAARVRGQAEEAEARLQHLISRVDEGLTAGAAALQETLNAADPGSPLHARSDSPVGRRTLQNPHWNSSSDGLGVSGAVHAQPEQFHQVPSGGVICSAPLGASGSHVFHPGSVTLPAPVAGRVVPAPLVFIPQGIPPGRR